MKISPTTAIESRGALLLIGMVAGFVLFLLFAYIHFLELHNAAYIGTSNQMVPVCTV